MPKSLLYHSVTHPIMGWVFFWSCFFIIWSIMVVSFSLAEEVIPIGTILKNPESYYLHVVTLAGTVRHVKSLQPPSVLSPNQPCFIAPSGKGGGVLYNLITFTLEDATGSIVVDRLAYCAPAGLKVPEVNEGDEVIIDAQIFGPDQDSEHRMVFPGERLTTHAIVKNIRRP